MAERILYYDCFAGISGDMHLGAMLDLGVPQSHIETELKKLGLSGWCLHCQKDSRKGITGTKVEVLLDGASPQTAQAPALHSHGHSHGSHNGVYWAEEPDTPARVQLVAAPAEYRSHRDIVAMITDSTLPEGTKARSLDIFARLAAAEGKIHGVPAETVTFHEVGAIDSIIDIVAAAIALEWLKPDKIYISTVELGSGFARCAHGLLPVPAPATVELLRGVPVSTGAVPFEATTPTGAAILAASAHAFTRKLEFDIESVGYGVGHREGPIPNLLRVFLGTDNSPISAKSVPDTREVAVLLECNIDDMSGETAGYVIEKLLSAGASDAWCTPITMKKSRPAITLSVLCRPEHEQDLARIILVESSTFGLRRSELEKTALTRSLEEIDTPYGKVWLKTGWLDGRRLKSKPEYDDLRRLAESHQLPLRKIEQAVLTVIAQRELP